MSDEERAGGEPGERTEIEPGTLVREHLANERTLLAWVRTGVGLISFGLVVERIGAQVSDAGISGAFGVGLAVLGCITLIMGTAQFLRSRREIATGNFVSTVTVYLIVVAGSLALAGTFIVYVLIGGP